jgi:hypothetical protein
MRKKAAYLGNNDLLFSPFVLDSIGRIGGCALRILRKLYAETHDIAVELSLERLKMKVGLAMIREHL